MLGITSCSFGKYGSRLEALQACSKWEAESGFYKMTKQYGSSKGGLVEYRIRSCRLESETNQFLGTIIKGVKPGGVYETTPESDFVLGASYKVVKHFRF